MGTVYTMTPDDFEYIEVVIEEFDERIDDEPTEITIISQDRQKIEFEVKNVQREIFLLALLNRLNLKYTRSTH